MTEDTENCRKIIRDVYKRADERMYENKLAIKSERERKVQNG